MLAAPLAVPLAQPLAAPITGGVTGYPPIRTIAFFGDSITNQNSVFYSASSISFDDSGFAVWAATILRQRFALARRSTEDFDFGYSNKRADEILNYVPDVIASGADTCFELSGTNDVAQGATPSQVAARRAALWSALRIGKMRVIAGAVPPAVNGAINTATTAANAAIKSAANAAGVMFVEWPETLLAEGVANVAYFPDGIHPNPLGAEIMGRHLASAIDSLVTADAYAFLDSADSNWITPNPYVTGSTGGLATSWTAAPAADITITKSKVSDWQQIAASGTGTGQSIVYAQNLTYPGGGWEIGDTVRGIAEIESDDAGFALKNLGAFARFHASTTGGNYHSTSSSTVSAMSSAHSPISGILLTPPVVIPAATARVQMYIQFYATGTFRFRKAGVFKV